MYVKMRTFPQLYKAQSQYPPGDQPPILHWYRQFIWERQDRHNRKWTANHLYSINFFEGPGSIEAIARHLSKVHGLSVTGSLLNQGPPDEVTEQIFRCINSAVYQPVEDEGALCDVQKVAVIVNRLRDRRLAYLLRDLGQKAISYFLMAGPLHYEVNKRGLLVTANERNMLLCNLSPELGLQTLKFGVEYSS